jgi:acyl carrier protein
MSVAEQIIAILEDKFEVPAHETGPATQYEDLGFDSLVLVELAVILQKRFGVEVEEEDLTNAKSIGDTAAMLHTKGVRV